MSDVKQHEHEGNQQGQEKNFFNSNFFPVLNSSFITNRRTPFCKLLILGDYQSTPHSKKNALLETSQKVKLSSGTGKNDSILVGEENGITLFISNFSYYEKHTAFPAYSNATMTVIIPNSDEDLRICFNSVYNNLHKPVKDSKVVYLNLFESSSKEYEAIESKAKELNFSDCKLILEPKSFDTLIQIALQHTRVVFDRLTQLNKPIEPISISQQPETTTTSCVIL